MLVFQQQPIWETTLIFRTFLDFSIFLSFLDLFLLFCFVIFVFFLRKSVWLRVVLTTAVIHNQAIKMLQLYRWTGCSNTEKSDALWELFFVFRISQLFLFFKFLVLFYCLKCQSFFNIYHHRHLYPCLMQDPVVKIKWIWHKCTKQILLKEMYRSQWTLNQIHNEWPDAH